MNVDMKAIKNIIKNINVILLLIALLLSETSLAQIAYSYYPNRIRTYSQTSLITYKKYRKNPYPLYRNSCRRKCPRDRNYTIATRTGYFLDPISNKIYLGVQTVEPAEFLDVR